MSRVGEQAYRMRAGAEPGSACSPHEGCITCGDEAAAMRIVMIDADRGLALCEDGAGARSSVEIALVGDVAPGEALLVHAGTAIARLQRDEARA